MNDTNVINIFYIIKSIKTILNNQEYSKCKHVNYLRCTFVNN